MPFSDVETTQRQFDLVRAACRACGRDEPVLSVAQTVAVGRDDVEVRRRLRRTGFSREHMTAGQGVYGVPGEVVEQLGGFAEVGASRVYCQVLDSPTSISSS